MIDVDVTRIFFAFLMLGIATIFDIKKREIHDGLWIGFGALAIIFTIIQFENIDSVVNTGISVIITCPLILVIWRLGLFGGADAFAIIVLSGLVPFATLSEQQITPFTTLINAGIFSLSILILNLIQNIKSISNHTNIFEGFDETKIRKLFACLIGNYSKNPKYGFSIQKSINNSKKFDFSMKHAEKTVFYDEPFTWITPGLPFILFIMIGFTIQIFFGDILFSFLKIM